MTTLLTEPTLHSDIKLDFLDDLRELDLIEIGTRLYALRRSLANLRVRINTDELNKELDSREYDALVASKRKKDAILLDSKEKAMSLILEEKRHAESMDVSERIVSAIIYAEFNGNR